MHSAGARVRHLCHCISPDVSVMEGQFWCQGIDNLLCLEGGAPQLISSLEAVAGDPSLGGTATEVSGRGGPGRYSGKSLAWEVRPAVPSFGCFESRRERGQICNHRLDIGCAGPCRGGGVGGDWMQPTTD